MTDDKPKRPRRIIRIIPRVLRQKDAPDYLGMDKNRFNSTVRPYLTVYKIGERAIGYDRLELDYVWEHHLSRNGTPAEKSLEKITCEQNTEHQQHLDLSGETASGTSTKESVDRDYARALERVLKRKRA